MSSTLTSAPWAAATPPATRRMPSSIASRVASETVRTVPSRLAVSGMTLRVVPASIFAIVSTAGSKTFTRRVTERLERLHHLARDGNRIEAVVRRRGVAALAAHDDLDRVAGSHRRSRARGDHAGRLPVRDVQGERAGGRRAVVEQAFLQH